MSNWNEDDTAMQTIRELATHKADIKHIEADMERMAKDIEEIKEALRSISVTLSETQGGWKTLLIVGGICTSVATAIAWLFDIVRH